MSVPAIAGLVVMALYNLIDTYWAARLGEDAVAALTVVFPWQMIVGAIGVGTGVGVSSLVSRRFGEGRGEQANRAAGQTLLIAGVAGPVLLVLALLFSLPIVKLFGATPAVEGLARDYLHAVALGVPWVIFLMASSGLYRGTGNTLFPTITMSTSAVLNAIFAPLFILGLWGAPRLGVTGLGLATALSQFLAALIALVYLWSPRGGYTVHLRHLRPHFGVMRDIFQVGAPAFAMQVTGSIVVSLYNGVLGGYGTAALAAYGINSRLLFLVAMPIFGTSQGLLPIVGFNYGARQYHRMWQAVKIAALGTAALGLVLEAALWLGARAMTHIFTRDPELERLTVLALRLTVLTLFLLGPQAMFISALQGMGHGPSALLLSLTRQLIFLLPGIYLLSARYGVGGAFAAGPVADALAFVVSAGFLGYIVRRFPPTRASEAEAALVAGEGELAVEE
ncbi:MAG TPA: MATE family efflux transporter [Armatimonadota bacterium]